MAGGTAGQGGLLGQVGPAGQGGRAVPTGSVGSAGGVELAEGARNSQAGNQYDAENPRHRAVNKLRPPVEGRHLHIRLRNPGDQCAVYCFSAELARDRDAEALVEAFGKNLGLPYLNVPTRGYPDRAGLRIERKFHGVAVDNLPYLFVKNQTILGKPDRGISDPTLTIPPARRVNLKSRCKFPLG